MFFPGDALVALLVTGIVCVAQLGAWVGGRGLLFLVAPFLPYVVLELGYLVARESALFRREREFDIHAYWRLRATQLSGPFGFFAPPFVLFWLLDALLRLDIIFKGMRDRVERFGNA